MLQWSNGWKQILVILILWTLMIAMAIAPVPIIQAATQPTGNEWFLARIGAPVAWAHEADGHGVKVLVIDSGIDITTTRAISMTHINGWTFSKQYPAGQDILGHGTFIASEIGGGGGHGYYGVAPQSIVASARIWSTGSSTGPQANPTKTAKAILWGIKQGFQVINISWTAETTDPYSGQPVPINHPTIREAIAKAHAAGVAVVCAAGNDGTNISNFPASDPGCLSVSATNFQDQVTAWSSTSPEVALSAPGEFISGFLPLHKNGIGGYGFATLEGTSMAAPLVVGAIADLVSLGQTPLQAEHVLELTARHNPGWDHTTEGYGEVDLTGALRYLGVL